ncbi:serine hydrolase domain-containing protein [Fretibacter rubidus]|uniref:serine hydrolase domain-containing protein n=1 Tax=Fretibacter rubidus TaxID=570162 RepID=UPI00352B81F5
MTDYPFTIDNAPGFDAVADQFRQNFADGLERGAQFVVLKDGKPVINMCGGWADDAQTKAVSHNTLIPVYSSGKAVAALVIAWLADEDRLGYDQIAATLWPDFAQKGKGELTIAQVLSHQSGLSGITDPDFTRDDWFNWDKVCAALAAQDPLFPPGSASGYHPVTYGFLAGEIARLADKDNRTLGQILRDELAAPLGADVWIGLPETEHHRVADMIKPKRMAKFGDMNPAVQAAFFQKHSSAGGTDITKWRKVELAGSNCHASAHGLATLMQAFNAGKVGDHVVVAPDIVPRMRSPRISGQDLVLPFDLTFAAGVMLNEPNFFFGPNAGTVGHSGWGGSCVFADPVTGLSGAYAMTRQDGTLLGDARPVGLIDAVYDCL